MYEERSTSMSLYALIQALSVFFKVLEKEIIAITYIIMYFVLKPTEIS